jgi:UDP-N-acetylglucosamine:LPS N-acetylglucosamine transferase
VEIARELLAMRPDVEIRFVSYGTGAETIVENGFPVIDLDLADAGGAAEVTVAAGRLIRWLDPDLVVSHEEFAAAPAAKIFEKRCVFVTDFFAEPELYSMHAIHFCDEILFVGREGVFEEPEWLNGRVRYLGPLDRPSAYGADGRARARGEFGIEPGAFVLGVFPGSWVERSEEFCDAVIDAYDGLPEPKALIWIAGREFDSIVERLDGRSACLVFRQYDNMDRAMSACSVSITRGSRGSTLELVNRGVPAIAVSWRLNPADDQAIEGLPGVRIVPGVDLLKGRLAEAVRDARPPDRPLAFSSFAECAAAIATHLPAAGAGPLSTAPPAAETSAE